MNGFQVKVKVRLGGQDGLADLALGHPFMDAHVVVKRVFVRVFPVADLAGEPLEAPAGGGGDRSP